MPFNLKEKNALLVMHKYVTQIYVQKYMYKNVLLTMHKYVIKCLSARICVGHILCRISQSVVSTQVQHGKMKSWSIKDYI